jgi:hypothetical protein
MAVDFDAVRREFPQLAEFTDAELQELNDFQFQVVRRKLLDMKQRGAEILAQRELERKAA